MDRLIVWYHLKRFMLILSLFDLIYAVLPVCNLMGLFCAVLGCFLYGLICKLIYLICRRIAEHDMILVCIPVRTCEAETCAEQSMLSMRTMRGMRVQTHPQSVACSRKRIARAERPQSAPCPWWDSFAPQGRRATAQAQSAEGRLATPKGATSPVWRFRWGLEVGDVGGGSET